MTGPPLRKVTIDGALDSLSPRPDLEPTVIIGEEVETCFPETGQWAHVNILGVDEAIHEDLKHVKRDIYDLVPYLRSRNLVHFLNHPLQSYCMQKKPMRFVITAGSRMNAMTRIVPPQGQGSRSTSNTLAMSLAHCRRRSRWVGAVVSASLRGEAPSYRNNRATAERLNALGIEAVDLWRGSHPSCGLTEFPDVARLRRSIVEIPCHQDIPLPVLDTAATLVRQVLGRPVERRAFRSIRACTRPVAPARGSS